MNSATNSVYVIDPDEAVHDALTELIGAEGFRVVCFRNAEDFLASDGTCGCLQGCVLAEADLPGMGSLAFLRKLRVRGSGIPVVVLTSTANSDIADQALRAGAVEVLPKPLVGERLLAFLRGLAEQNVESRTEPGGRSHA